MVSWLPEVRRQLILHHMADDPKVLPMTTVVASEVNRLCFTFVMVRGS